MMENNLSVRASNEDVLYESEDRVEQEAASFFDSDLWDTWVENTVRQPIEGRFWTEIGMKIGEILLDVSEALREVSIEITDTGEIVGLTAALTFHGLVAASIYYIFCSFRPLIIGDFGATVTENPALEMGTWQWLLSFVPSLT